MYMFNYLKKKAQGLPINTIVIIILVVIVLVAIALLFFSSFISGKSGIQTGIEEASKGVNSLGTAPTPWR